MRSGPGDLNGLKDFLIIEGKQLCSYAVMMGAENWSATLLRISASLISMVIPWSAACRSVE